MKNISDNWVVRNLENAIGTWNEKLAELWQLVSQSPESFRGGQIWGVIVNIHTALVGVGYGLLVLFFAMGVFQSAASFRELQRPEFALRHFIRFALAKLAVGSGLEIMTAIFTVCGSVISAAMSGMGGAFIKSYTGVCLEGAVIVLACLIYSAFLSGSAPATDGSLPPVTMAWEYIGQLIFNMLILTGLVKGSDRVVREMFSL